MSYSSDSYRKNRNNREKTLIGILPTISMMLLVLAASVILATNSPSQPAHAQINAANDTVSGNATTAAATTTTSTNATAPNNQTAAAGNATTATTTAASISFNNPKRIVGTPGADAEPPQIATSGRNAYIIWHEFFPTGTVDPDIFLSRSTNRGEDFGVRKNLSNSPNVDSRDEQIAVSGKNGKNVYVVWSDNENNQNFKILFSRSNDEGKNFSPAKTLSTAGEAITPQIVASGENVYVVWAASGQGGLPDIFFTQSNDRGRNFKNEENISNNAGDSESPDIGLSGNNVIVTWRDNTGNDFEIFFTQGG
jgi:hypothetical protein